MTNISNKKIVVFLFIVLLLTIFVVVRVWMDRSVTLGEGGEITFDFDDFDKPTVNSTVDKNIDENTNVEIIENQEHDIEDENQENIIESEYYSENQENDENVDDTDNVSIDDPVFDNNEFDYSSETDNIDSDANSELEKVNISLNKNLDGINKYKFEGKIDDSLNIDKIMVSWIYDGKESNKYKLSKYSLGDDIFNYFAALDLGNLKFGENKYRFYFYSGDDLVGFQDDVIYIDKILRQDDLCSNGFCIDMNDDVNVSDDDNYISQTKNGVEIKYDIDNDKIFVENTNSNGLIK